MEAAMETGGENLMELLRGAVRASFPVLDEDAQRVSLALYRALAGGQPVNVDQLARTPGLPDIDVVRALVDAWPAVYRDESGGVIGYWGLALGGTGHRIEVNGVELTTWCAWDTLFLPQILDAEIAVDSPCPVTGERIRLQVGPEGVRDAQPTAPALSFLDPTDKVGDGVISAFCHHIHFFVDRATGERWTADRSDAILLSLHEGVDLAREANRARYPGVFGSSAE